MIPPISSAPIFLLLSRLSRTAPYSSAVLVTRDETRKLAFSVSPSKTPYLIFVLPMSIANSISLLLIHCVAPARG